MLAKQLLSIPIIGGLNEKEDSLLSMRPRVMTNCLYRKTGSVSKRYGYDCIARINTRKGGGSPPTGELLCTYNDELLRIGGGYLDSYQTISTTSDWVSRGQVPEAVAEIRGIASAGVSATTYTNPAVSYANGFIISCYITNDGTNYTCFVDVTNAETGARVYSRYAVKQSTDALRTAKTVATGTKALVAWSNDASDKIQGAFLDLTTMTWGTTADVVTSVATGGGLHGWDCDAVSASEWLFFYEINSGTNRLTYKTIATTITAGAFDNVAGPTALSTTDTATAALSIKYAANERIWLAYGRFDGANNVVRVATATLALTNSAGPTTVYSTTGDIISEVGIERFDDSNCVVNWNHYESGTCRWAKVSATTSVAFTGALKKALFLSKPLVRSGKAMALIALVHPASTQFLIDLHVDTGAVQSNGSPRMIACVLPRQLGAIGVTLTTRPRFSTLSNWANPATNQYLVASLVVGPDTGLFSIIGLLFKFDSAWKRTTCTAGNLLVIGGGAIHYYDGSQAAEAAFAYEPDSSLISLTPTTGGSMDSDADYGYVFVYCWTDGQGNVHRSAPSVARTVAMGASDTQVGGSVPCLHLTNKDSSSATPNLSVEIYRTIGDGSEYFYHSTVRNVCGSAPIAFTDQTADSALDSTRRLYTDGGSVDHVIPAGGNLVSAWKNALIVGGTDDDSVWLSGEIVPREGPWFNDGLTIDPFDGGRVVAIGNLDDTPIFFKAESASYFMGDPPADNGDINSSLPKRIQTEEGCTDPASILSTSDGVYHRGASGIFLLNRSLADTWVGAGVEDSLRDDGFAGASSLPSQGLVRFLQRGTGGADALNLDQHHSEMYGSPVWSKDVLRDVRGNTDASPVACTVWQGSFVWLSAAGYLYQETTERFADSDGASTYAWVPMAFEAAFEKAAGVAAYQRVRRVFVTGLATSPHELTVTLTSDIDSESRTWDGDEVVALPGYPQEKVRVHVAGQKCQWMSVAIADAQTDDEDLGDYSGMTLRDITVEFGVKPGGGRRVGKK